MQLTTHTDYALRLLIFIAVRKDSTPARVQDAAARYGISANHVAKVAQTLVQLGYLHSFRGRGGGLALAMPAESINIGALVRRTENLRLLECFGPDSTCPIDPACVLKRALAEAQQAFLQVLDGYDLSDLVVNGDVLHELLGRP
jgi:Rrf2 family nitric oxide-sensitive transcriptional repressor